MYARILARMRNYYTTHRRVCVCVCVCVCVTRKPREMSRRNTYSEEYSGTLTFRPRIQS